jgi:sugar-specific transcriptional regulator TrmB
VSDEARPLPKITGNGEHATVRLIDHIAAIRAGDVALQEERDRRYAEVNVEKEKALKIKETADLAALQLAREIQTYKDEKANELREQIASERGAYVTVDKLESVIRELQATRTPIVESISALTRRVDQGEGSDAGRLVAENRAVRNFDARIAIYGIIVAILVVVSNIGVSVILHP